MARWEENYIDRDFDRFWTDRTHEANVRVLVILAVGFDPRSLATIQRLSKLDSGNCIGYFAFKLDSRPTFGQSDTVIEDLSAANLRTLEGLKSKREGLHKLPIHDDEGHPIIGRKILEVMHGSLSILEGYSDVVVDISGMPRAAYFPLIAYLLRLADSGVFQNLHVSVIEDPLLDSSISRREYGQADYLHTFRHHSEAKIVWLPMLGDNDVNRLEKIYNRVKSQCIEICPILPFPAMSLRRVDDAAVQHSEVLFEALRVSFDNLILCDERSPFDVYRKILEIEEYYSGRLGAVPSIGTTRTVVSPLSSKSMSLGMLLAAIERNLAVCYVEAGSYSLQENVNSEISFWTKYNPIEIWIAGEPYTT